MVSDYEGLCPDAAPRRQPRQSLAVVGLGEKLDCLIGPGRPAALDDSPRGPVIVRLDTKLLAENTVSISGELQ